MPSADRQVVQITPDVPRHFIGAVPAELLREGGVVGGVVEAHAQDGGLLGVELGLEVAEPATLDGSARGVSDGIEP